MPTTRLSRVMTGCGGKLTTCSRRSIKGRSRSTNGVTTFRPAFSVRWYRPNRSTIPAVACGMIRMARTMRTTTTTSRMVATRVLMIGSPPRPGSGLPGSYLTLQTASALGQSAVLAWGDDPPGTPRDRGTHPPGPALRPLLGAGGPAGLAVLDLELDAEAPGQVPRGEHLVDRPGGQHRPA